VDGGDSTERRTAKVAARGTGYSGTTLDKVTGIREVAEQGVIWRWWADVSVRFWASGSVARWRVTTAC
jgi:hypothetical protein